VASESRFCAACGLAVTQASADAAATTATEPKRNTTRSSLGWNVAQIAFIAFIAWIYISPYLALRSLREAAESANIEALNEAVDFPAFRASLKGELSGQIAKADLGGIVVGALVGGFIDQQVTPQFMVNMFQGKDIPEVNLLDIWTGMGKNENEVRVSSGYESFDRFGVRIFPPKSRMPITLVWLRSGPKNWRLSGIRLPDLNQLTRDMDGANTGPQHESVPAGQTDSSTSPASTRDAAKNTTEAPIPDSVRNDERGNQGNVLLEPPVAEAPPVISTRVNPEAAELRAQWVVLATRVNAARTALRSFEEQQSREGIVLRADIREARTRMDEQMKACISSLQNGDMVGARQSLQYAQSAAETIEKFLGR
jgi:hypothetical protein